jgi:hypothetical protein
MRVRAPTFRRTSAPRASRFFTVPFETFSSAATCGIVSSSGAVGIHSTGSAAAPSFGTVVLPLLTYLPSIEWNPYCGIFLRESDLEAASILRVLICCPYAPTKVDSEAQMDSAERRV